MALKKDIQYINYHVSSSDVKFIEFSREVGYCNDYGHLDLNLGFHAQEEVYPEIYNWLKLHSKTNS